MKKITRRRTEIKIETHEISIIRIRGDAGSTFCEQCRSQTTSFTVEQIALLLQIPLSEVCRRIEDGEFHLTGTERGLALVCGDSLK